MSGNIQTIIFSSWTNAVMQRNASAIYFEYSTLFTKCSCKFLNVTLFYLLEIISPKVNKKVVDHYQS